MYSQILNRPEHELILSCARTVTNQETIKKIEYLLAKKIDWDYLIQTAIRHGVVQCTCNTLAKDFTQFIPPSSLNKLQEIFYRNVGHNLGLTAELLKVLRTFKDYNIAAIPFKGPVLAISAYGSLSLRQISDIDILIEEHNFQKASEIFMSQGYIQTVEKSWENHFTTENGFYTIDLHKEIAPRFLSGSLMSSYIWGHDQFISIFEEQVRTFTPEICLLVLCINGTKECWQSLSRICDVAELIRTHSNMNWQKVVKQAEEMGLKRSVYLGLFLAESLLNASFPSFLKQQVSSDSVVKTLALQVNKRLFPQDLTDFELEQKVTSVFFYLKTRDCWQDRVKSLFGLVSFSRWMFPTEKDKNIISSPLPNMLSFLYHIIRPIRLFLKYRNVFLIAVMPEFLTVRISHLFSKLQANIFYLGDHSQDLIDKE